MTVQTKINNKNNIDKAITDKKITELNSDELVKFLFTRFLSSLYQAVDILLRTFITYFILAIVYTITAFGLLVITHIAQADFFKQWFTLHQPLFLIIQTLATLACIFIQFLIKLIIQLIKHLQLKLDEHH